MSDTDTNPAVVVLAGPNGAGKSTAASVVLPELLRIPIFVNADTIARGLAAFAPETAAIAAGRIMLDRLTELADAGESFAFETTLASRTFAKRLRAMRTRGYSVNLVFVWVSTPELSVRRVADRVRLGGHHVPTEDIHRRYERGLQNFFRLYRPLADRWWFFDNSTAEGRRVIAEHTGGQTTIHDQDLWDELEQRYGDPD